MVHVPSYHCLIPPTWASPSSSLSASDRPAMCPACCATASCCLLCLLAAIKRAASRPCAADLFTIAARRTCSHPTRLHIPQSDRLVRSLSFLWQLLYCLDGQPNSTTYPNNLHAGGTLCPATLRPMPSCSAGCGHKDARACIRQVHRLGQPHILCEHQFYNK